MFQSKTCASCERGGRNDGPRCRAAPSSPQKLHECPISRSRCAFSTEWDVHWRDCQLVEQIGSLIGGHVDLHDSTLASTHHRRSGRSGDFGPDQHQLEYLHSIATVSSTLKKNGNLLRSMSIVSDAFQSF